MSIERFYTTTISVKRMSWSNESSAEVVVDASVKGHIQQATPDLTLSLGEVLGKVFTIWCAKGEDILPGDTIIIASGDYAGTYSVRGTQINAVGSNQHLEIIAIKGTP